MKELTGFGFLEHQRDRHNHVISDREADLQVRAERKLHPEEDVAEDRHELRVCSRLNHVEC